MGKIGKQRQLNEKKQYEILFFLQNKMDFEIIM